MDPQHLLVELPHARVVFTTRHGGVSEGPYATLNLGDHVGDDPDAVAENRRRVADGGVLQHSRQVHGTVLSETGGGEADGQVVRERGRAAMVLVADCLPIALAGPAGVATVHAGWRGLAGGIVAAGVRALGGAVTGAAIGPGAGGCCYEVGPEVHARFGTSGRTLDLKAIAARQLREAGVATVHDTGACTMCDPRGRFFSHRRDNGVTGRQAGIAWIR